MLAPANNLHKSNSDKSDFAKQALLFLGVRGTVLPLHKVAAEASNDGGVLKFP